MKIKLGNLPYNANGENIPYFSTQEECDVYLERVYSTEWVESKSFKKTSQTVIEVKVNNKNIADGFKYNFMSVDVQGEITHYNIIGTYSTNARTITYTGVVDMHINFPTLLEELKDFMMTQGHCDSNKYKGLEFDGGDYEVKEYEVLKPIVYNDTLPQEGYSKGWYFIFLKISNSEKGTIYVKGNNKVEMPFRLYAIPTDELFTTDDDYVFSSEGLNRFISDNSANVLGVKFSSFNPLILANPYVPPNDKEDYLNASLEEVVEDVILGKWLVANIFRFDVDNLINQNTYKVKVDKSTVEENISGVKEWKLMIEDLKEIDVPTYVLNFNEDDISFTFIHHFVPTPNETEEYVEFKKDNYETFRDERSVIENSKEIIYGVNAYDTYAANNPVSSKLEIIGSALNGFLTGSSLTTFFMGDKILSGGFFDKVPGGSIMDVDNKIPGTDLSEEYLPSTILEGDTKVGLSKLGKMSMTFGAIGAVRRTTKTIVNRQNMKKSKNKVKGSGSLIPDLGLNKSFYNFILQKIEYTTNERENIVNSIYMNGISHSNLIVNKFEDIKRKKFNLVNIINLDVILDKKYYQKYGTEVINNLIQFHKKEKRYWYRWDGIGEFDFEGRDDNE